MDISVILCTYNRATLLEGALLALGNQRVVSSINWEILVVDNNSTDQTRDVIRRFSDVSSVPVSYLFEKQQGKCFALNTGIQSAKGNILAFTDDDCTPGLEWVENLAHAFKRWDADGVGGRILPKWAHVPPSWLENEEHLLPELAILTSKTFRWVELQPSDKSFGIRIWGSNMAFRRSVFESVGVFNTNLGPRGYKLYRGEEAELVTRAVAARKRVVYEPDVYVWHWVGPERMRKRYFRKHAFDYGEGLGILEDLTSVPNVFGIQPYLLRLSVRHGVDWIRSLVKHDAEAFCRELQVLEDLGYLAGHVKSTLRARRYIGVRKTRSRSR